MDIESRPDRRGKRLRPRDRHPRGSGDDYGGYGQRQRFGRSTGDQSGSSRTPGSVRGDRRAELGQQRELDDRHAPWDMVRCSDERPRACGVTASTLPGAQNCTHVGIQDGTVGDRGRVRLYDDRLVLYAGTDELMTLPRGHAGPGGRRGRVVDFRHVLPSLRRKPMALLNWVHRDGLFHRDAYRRAFDALPEGLDDRRACRRMVDLLALAHDQCCEARLATEIEVCLGGPGWVSPGARVPSVRRGERGLDLFRPGGADSRTGRDSARTRCPQDRRGLRAGADGG